MGNRLGNGSSLSCLDQVRAAVGQSRNSHVSPSSRCRRPKNGNFSEGGQEYYLALFGRNWHSSPPSRLRNPVPQRTDKGTRCGKPVAPILIYADLVGWSQSNRLIRFRAHLTLTLC